MAKILVVEDDKALRHLYKLILEGEYEVGFAVNGQEGFNKATSEKYDLIITDLDMGPWNGAEQIEALSVVNPDQKYIVVSGHLSRAHYKEVLQNTANIVGQIAKPFDRNNLLKLISNSISS